MTYFPCRTHDPGGVVTGFWWRGLIEDADRSRTYQVGIRESLASRRVWALAAVYFGIVYGLYAVGFFLPTIIKGFESQFHVTYSIMQLGLITAIPHVFGAVAMVAWGYHGDRTGERVWARRGTCDGATHQLPRGRCGSQRARTDQLRRQHRRLPRPVHHRLALRSHR